MISFQRIVFGVALALVLLACCVDAHGWMSYPSPRGQYASPKKYAYQEIAPASTDPNSQDFVCRNDPEMPKENWLSLTAGKTQTINLDITAKHVGDCFVYLTYDGDKPMSEMKWFKIWEQHKCRDQDSYEITIPSYLPSGEHVIFRWEWYALHVFPTVEYYAQCVDAKLSGSATGSLPQPQVKMPGHLPKSISNEYWNPFNGGAEFFVGPKLATLNGQPNPTTAPTPAATAAPTTAPTSKPTVAPPVQPTTRPTSEPTAAPTAAPTSAPTTAPTRTPTAAPTTVPTKGATPSPIAGTVKLTSIGSTGVWWFAATVSGPRSNDVVSVQIKDSNNIDEFEDCTNEWANVWTFNPLGKGPFVFPLTVKATVSTGASIVFYVNSVSTISVDSGDIFA